MAGSIVLPLQKLIHVLKSYNHQNNVILNNIILNYFYQMFSNHKYGFIVLEFSYPKTFHVKKSFIWCQSLIFAHLEYL